MRILTLCAACVFVPSALATTAAPVKVLKNVSTTRSFAFGDYYDTGGDFPDQVQGDETPDDISFSHYGFRATTREGRQWVIVKLSIQCDLGRTERENTYRIRRMTPFTIWRAATIRKAESCYVIFSASRYSQEAHGRMVVTLLGKNV